MVIPDTGLLLLPMRPTIREDTVAKKKPKITIRKALNRLTGTAGISQISNARTTTPMIIAFIGISLSVRSSLPVFPLP